MIIDDRLKIEKLKYDINREAAKISTYPQVKLMNINILQLKKYYHLTKVEQQKKQNLHVPLSIKHLKNK